jgi:hypothetical protein
MKKVILLFIMCFALYGLRAQTAPTVTPNSVTINCGDTAIFTASGSVGNYLWYSDSLGVNLIDSGSTLYVGPLCSDATVYVVGTLMNTTYNFTNCGVTGRTGPTQADVNTAYASTSLDGNVSIISQGIQEWIVPATGMYRIEIAGAKGSQANGGPGAILQGDFLLTAGDTLQIIVGQEGGNLGTSYASGGGGSFVAIGDDYTTASPLIIAGGGGGVYTGATLLSGTYGSTSTSGSAGQDGTLGGINGNGGNASTGTNAPGAGGGGFYTNGGSVTGTRPVEGGIAFQNGGNGGQGETSMGSGVTGRPDGGFGGAGGSGNYPGGGGGYSGGGSTGTSGLTDRSSGGGGSFVHSSATNLYTSDGEYDNLTTFNSTAINNLASYNSGHGYVNITFLDTVISPFAAAQITVNQIADPVVSSSVSVCEDDSIVLTASGSTGNFYWFADSLGNIFLGEGTSYETGAINSDTMIYVQAYSDSIEHTYTFTNCGVTGRTGPTQADIDAAYGPSLLNGKVDITTQGIQEWVVPYTATYTIEVAGAQGGGVYGGLGANMQGDFNLTAGDTVKILVGQEGTALTSSRFDYSGGGGSFVTYYDNTPLIIAAGGGGAEISGVGSIGQTTTAGRNGSGGYNDGVGGTGGNGGTTGIQTTDGGAGLLADGGSGNPNPAPQAFINGGEGGSNAWTGGGVSADGGFGGGGASNRNDLTYHGAGGGGGYSGGGSSYGNSTSQPIAGGGGSYNIGTNQTNTAGTNMGHGYVRITVNAPICYSDIVPIEINVDTLPEITTQPVDVAITEGNNASFTITAVGTGISYQWQESTDSSTTWADLSNNATYSGVNTASLTITSASLSMDNYYYRCIVDGTCPPPDTSNAGILEVNSTTGIDSEAFNSINVYPNPVKTKLIVEIDSKTNDEAIVSVFDVLGNLLLEHKYVNLVKGSNRIEINMENLANGIYYLRIIAATEQQQFSIIKK